MSKNVYHIGSGALTFEIIERIINENLKLELAPEAKLRIQKCRDYLDQKIASSEEPLYGITTGFGSLCTKNISPDELGTLQENLIKSHACSVGEEIRPVIIKLMMLLKAHALSLGHSGVQVITVQRILDFFNNDVMPIVYDRGSLGASGDLAPLANLFLPLIGVGDVYYKGKKCEAISVLDEFGWEPVKLMSKEGLALLNGTQFMVDWERLPDLKAASQQRNVLLHPEFVNGKYALYTRPQDDFINAGNGGGIGWALIDDITRAEVKEEMIINHRYYHTIKEVKNGEGVIKITNSLRQPALAGALLFSSHKSRTY